jgi:cytochrome c biogenesis protein CcmG/thiol:disulfide interchange protein DsbE
VAAVATVLVFGIRAARDSGPAPVTPAPARPESAPPLAGEDPITGRRVSLAAYAGKPVVINVWASWCVGCNKEAVDLREFARAHPEAQLLGVDFDDSKAAARAFYRRWSWSHPSIFDPKGTLAAKLKLQGLPMTVFLNRRHQVVARIYGATDRAGFEEGLRKAATA